MSKYDSVPHSIVAEQAVLGSLLLSGESGLKSVSWLEPEDFYSAIHQRIFRVMQSLDGPLDVVTVATALDRDGSDDDNKPGSAYLAELVQLVPSWTHLLHYARIVRQSRVQREAITQAGKLLNMAQEQQSPEAIHAELMQAVEHLTMVWTDSRHYRSLEAGLHKYLDDLDTEQPRGVRFGIPELDKLTGGMQAGNLVVIGGFTSMGKTSLALQVARQAAATVPVLFFTLEMSETEIIERLLASETGQSVQTLRKRSADLEEAEILAVVRAAAKLSTLKLWLDDRSGLSLADIEATARQWCAEQHGALVVIDYAQKVLTKAETRTQEMSAVAKGLKNLAKDLGIPFLVPAQLTRGSGHRWPSLTDMAESIDFSREADAVILLHRPAKERGDPVAGPQEVSVILAKQRNGPTGTVKCLWFPERMIFGTESDLSEADQEMLLDEPETGTTADV